MWLRKYPSQLVLSPTAEDWQELYDEVAYKNQPRLYFQNDTFWYKGLLPLLAF